jgi:UDP-N-acetylglucosamine 1-carboxyvinyltransferase
MKIHEGSAQISPGRLVGKVELSGAKNAGLKLLTASILTDGRVEITNSPNELLDVKVHIGMLEKMGKECKVEENTLIITENKSLTPDLIWDERSIRNSLLMLGALVTRFGRGRVPLPGGCRLGDRKYDIHVMVMEALGARVFEEGNYLCAEVPAGSLQGSDLFLPIRSTGATENAILMGSLAKGTTTIWNPHIRPEVINLVEMLNKMGARIRVHGQKSIVIEGIESLQGVSQRVIPDNMEAITWAIGSAITGGDLEIIDFPFEHLEVPLAFLQESGMRYYKGENSIIVRASSPYPIEISTGPYPGINSDMQPLFAVFGAMSKGISKIVDLRFPGRYNYATELQKMGLEFEIRGDFLVIQGGKGFKGAETKAPDLRGGMALVLAGLVAEGETVISDFWQVERGYEKFSEKLSNVLV